MSSGMTRLIDTYGHKPACNDAGNPPDCTCEVEAQAIMKQQVDVLAERIDREGVERIYKTVADKPRIVSPEEVAARTGIDVDLLRQVHTGINAMLNDKKLKATVDAQFYRGKMADVVGLEWYMDAETPNMPPGTPLTAGAQQTGRTISTDGWSAPQDDDE